jgi:hypothetical protein
MRRRHILQQRYRLFGWVLLWFCLSPAYAQDSPALAGQPPQPVETSLRELREEVRDLKAAVAEMRAETSRYREESLQMRRELESTRGGSNSTPLNSYEAALAPVVAAPVQPPPAQPGVTSEGAKTSNSTDSQPLNSTEHTAKLEEEYDLLSGKVDEYYQSKVESASKYRVRLSGVVLFNLFSNKGFVENQDIPTVALPVPPGVSSGSFGATLRQSQLGLEVFGPHIAGARASADLQLDFAGGFQSTWNGVNTGIVRLRTATLRLDWANTSIIAGQDGLFFTPSSPTSFASLAVPALTYAGNLWSWTPQVRVEHRFTVSENTSFLVQGGILDNLTGDFPVDPNFRYPQPGELSRQPAYASRVAWSQTIFGQKFTLGGGSYYGRQSYGFGRNVNGWAAMSDWNLPVGRVVSLSGKLYRGNAVGGIGATIGTSIVYSADPTLPTTTIHGLDAIGGWSQLKLRVRPTLEFNAAFGQDDAFANQVRAGLTPHFYLDSVVRNRGFQANFISRPRSDLLFSAEYRHLASTAFNHDNQTANQINLVMGVLF